MNRPKFYYKPVKAVQFSIDNFDIANEFTGNRISIIDNSDDSEEYALMIGETAERINIGDFIVAEDGELHVVPFEKFLGSYRPL